MPSALAMVPTTLKRSASLSSATTRPCRSPIPGATTCTSPLASGGTPLTVRTAIAGGTGPGHTGGMTVLTPGGNPPGGTGHGNPGVPVIFGIAVLLVVCPLPGHM